MMWIRVAHHFAAPSLIIRMGWCAADVLLREVFKRSRDRSTGRDRRNSSEETSRDEAMLVRIPFQHLAKVGMRYGDQRFRPLGH